MSEKRVCIAFCQPMGNRPAAQYVQSFLHLDRSGLAPWHHFEMRGWEVEAARNELTQAALAAEPKATHLFWIDDDMTFAPNALKRLLAHDVPFVGGVCHDRRHPFKPILGREFDPSWGYAPGAIGWFYDYPPDELLDVHYTGGAFLLIKREVFEAVREMEVEEQVQREQAEVLSGRLTPFDPGTRRVELRASYKGWWTRRPVQGSSEDLSFCWRARRAGYQIKVDTGCKIGHVGEVVITEEFVKRNRDFEYHQWHPPLDALAEAVGMRPATDPDAADVMVRDDTQKPLVTVVIPTYNTPPEFLQAAVKSVLAQSVPCECIVVDDGSTVPVKEANGSGILLPGTHLPPHPNLHVVRHGQNRGISAAINTGLKLMTTNWFCWLSADDLFEPDKVARQLASLLNARRLAGFHGYSLKLDNANSIVHVSTPRWWNRQDQNRILGDHCCIFGSTVMLHRSVIEKVGGPSEEYRYGQDWEWWRRVGFHFDWFWMPDKLVTRREFGNLTERISKDERLRAVRDAEDVKIRAMREEDYK